MLPVILVLKVIESAGSVPNVVFPFTSKLPFKLVSFVTVNVPPINVFPFEGSTLNVVLPPLVPSSV